MGWPSRLKSLYERYSMRCQLFLIIFGFVAKMFGEKNKQSFLKYKMKEASANFRRTQVLLKKP